MRKKDQVSTLLGPLSSLGRVHSKRGALRFQVHWHKVKLLLGKVLRNDRTTEAVGIGKL